MLLYLLVLDRFIFNVCAETLLFFFVYYLAKVCTMALRQRFI